MRACVCACVCVCVCLEKFKNSRISVNFKHPGSVRILHLWLPVLAGGGQVAAAAETQSSESEMTTGYRPFDEESFSDVLTYYGSNQNNTQVRDTAVCGGDPQVREREREKFINHKQINNVTIKIINSCGRLPARKIPSSWPLMQIRIILFYM